MRNIFEGIRCVLFDMDGTLVETDIDFPLMKREMLALAGRYGVSESEVQGLDILAVVERVVDTLEREGRRGEALDARREAFERLESIELEPCRNARIIPYALELLDALRCAGMRIGIVTRNCRTGVRLSSERTGVRGDILLTRDDVRNTKPHPEHLLRALEELGIEPGEALMVGDHWMDVQAGKSAGARTVGFLRPDRPTDYFDRVQPDLVVRDLRELIELLER